MSKRATLRLGAVLAAALAMAACSDKNGGTSGPSPQTELDAQTVQQQALSTMGFVNGLVDGVDEMAAGDFSGVTGDLGLPEGSSLREESSAVWSDSLGAWVLDAQGTEADESGIAEYDVYFLVRFVDGNGAPQQNPDETTASMVLQLDYVVDYQAQQDGSTLDLLLDYQLDMSIAGLPNGPFDLDGLGDMSIAMGWSGDGGSGNIALGMGWNMALDVPSDGACPTGTAGVTLEGWRFDAVYDGTPSYDWTLYEGLKKVGEGSEPLSCTVPLS